MYSTAMAFGGNKELGVKSDKKIDFDKIIRKGIPMAAGSQLKEKLSLTDKDFADIIGLSARTFTRKKKAGGNLPPEASDRLFRLARVFAFAVEVLGEENYAKAWLNTPNIALGNETPIDLIRTDAGTEEVKNLLGRIKYGVPL